MRFVIQRVTESSVTVDEKVIGKIGKGFMVLIGIADGDTREMADKLVSKMVKLRIRRRRRENQSFAGRCRRFTAPDLAVHFICRLQKRQPAGIYKCRRAGFRKRNV